MELTLFSLAGLALCGAFFFAGVIDAVSGGGGLVSMPTFLAVGFPVHHIMGTSQCAILPGIALMIREFARGGKIAWKPALMCAPFCLLGGHLGARLNVIAPEELLKTIMVVMVPLIAVFVLAKKDFGLENCSDTLSKPRLVANCVLIGTLIGAYQGFYGAGSGTLCIFAFCVLNRVDLVTASGSCKVMLFFSSLAAAATYIAEGLVAWDFVVAVVAFNMLGSFLGARLALTKGARVIRPLFLAVLVGLVAKLVWDLVM